MEFKAVLDKARSDAAVFAVLTVVMTPVFVAVAVMALVFALALVDRGIFHHLSVGASFLTGLNLTALLLLASYFLRPKPHWQRHRSDENWTIAAIGLFCVLLAVSYATPLAETHPTLFWPMYLFFFLGMMGCMGHAYEPHDDYYLGWTVGPVLYDNPFTLQDDIDRAHLSLGFLVAISEFILGSYATIFGSRWLWRGL